MERLEAWRRWIDAYRDVWLDMVRVYLGVGLFVKGIDFIGQQNLLLETMESSTIPYTSSILAHYVTMAHLGGGLLLALGLVTRVAAVVQVPVLVGAVFFVHADEGLFTREQTLEFAVLVLFLLVVFSVAGAGRMSLDTYLARRPSRDPTD